MCGRLRLHNTQASSIFCVWLNWAGYRCTYSIHKYNVYLFMSRLRLDVSEDAVKCFELIDHELCRFDETNKEKRTHPNTRNSIEPQFIYRLNVSAGGKRKPGSNWICLFDRSFASDLAGRRRRRGSLTWMVTRARLYIYCFLNEFQVWFSRHDLFHWVLVSKSLTLIHMGATYTFSQLINEMCLLNSQNNHGLSTNRNEITRVWFR